MSLSVEIVEPSLIDKFYSPTGTVTAEPTDDGEESTIDDDTCETGTTANIVQTPFPISGVNDGAFSFDSFNVVVFHYSADKITSLSIKSIF